MQYKKPEIKRSFGSSVAAIVLSLALGACSSVPNWANPVEWYKGTAEWIVGDDDEVITARKAARAPKNVPPNANQPFPNLSAVPARPQGIDSRVQRRQQVERGLISDRRRARHAALSPGDSAKPSPRNVPGAPVRPKLAVPSRVALPRIVTKAPTKGNQTFQKAIAQQSAPKRRAVGPVRRNTMGVPPSSRGGITLIPPDVLTTVRSRRQLKRSAPPQLAYGPIGIAGRSVSVGTIFFANGSSKISGKYNKTLRAIVNTQKTKGGNFRVVGHASSRTRDIKPLGHQIANFRISLARAEAVAHQLMLHGAPGSVAVTGVSDNQPIYHEFMPLGEAGNRRVEIYLDY